MVVHLDHKLRIAQSELPSAVHDHIVDALSIPNVERQKAMEQDVWGWRDMPETISLWSHVDGYLVMPRGFEAALLEGLGTLELEFHVEDRRFYKPLFPLGRPIELHKWQRPAVDAILSHEQGIYKAPAASGKTVAVLEAIRRSQGRSIVLVNTKDILWQWVNRVREHLGEDFPVGQIGDGIFEPSEYITISTIQTLHSKYVDIEESGFFDSFSFMCLDECHHATAETYNRIVNRFSSRYRIGVSATPDKTGDFTLATNVLGPIFHETKRRDVDTLVQPDVFRIPTSFDAAYEKRVDYARVLKRLITDDHRNRLIAKSILIEEGSRALVVSRRLEHFEILKEMLVEMGYECPILTLTGKESSEERQEIVALADQQPCVIFSTLADEALDIPRLDRIFLVFPQRNPGLVEQQIGRVCRAHPDKETAKVFDYHDHRVGPLDNQWRQRRLRVYQPHGYSITTVLPESIFSYEIS